MCLGEERGGRTEIELQAPVKKPSKGKNIQQKEKRTNHKGKEDEMKYEKRSDARQHEVREMERHFKETNTEMNE